MPYRTIKGMDGNDELNERECAQWNAVGAAMRRLADRAGGGDLVADDVQATFEQLRRIPLVPQRILNSIHPPREAGEHAEALVAILHRIPDGWGRWIECDLGWYPLIVEHDARLAALCPEYVVHQVKEKYGTLRYYASPCSAHGRANDEFDALEWEAEKRSAHICEDCGAPGRLCVNARWYRTLCDDCVEVESANKMGRYEPVPPRKEDE